MYSDFGNIQSKPSDFEMSFFGSVQWEGLATARYSDFGRMQ